MKTQAFSLAIVLCFLIPESLAQNLLRVEYGETVVVSSKREKCLFVLSIIADPIGFADRATGYVWRFHNIDDLNEALSKRGKLDREKGQMTSTVTLIFEETSDQSILNVSLSWFPVDATTCYVDFFGFEETIDVYRYKPNNADQKLVPNQFLTIEAYATKDLLRISDAEKSRREKIIKFIGY